jgi:ankyrin repeat protein
MTPVLSMLLRFSFILLLLISCRTVTAAPAITLIDSAKSGDRNAVLRQLLDESVDVNATMPDGTTALHWAVLHDDVELATRLLESGASPDTSNEYGVSPLYLACTNRSSAMVQALLQAGVKVNTTLLSGESVLMNCARTGAAEAVKLLLDAGADRNHAEPVSGQTALMWAAAAGHADIVKLLLASGADLHARTRHGIPTIPGTCRVCDWKVSTGDFTPLLFAAQSGDIETAKTLLDAGADPDESTALHGNSLVIASAGGHEELALYLIERGADIHSADENGITALHHAVGAGLSLLNGVIYDNVYRLRPRNLYRLAEVLLQAGADPNVQIREEQLLGPDGYPFTMVGATPLLLATAAADIRMMQILLQAGANPAMNNEQGITLLMAAAQIACTGTCAYQAGGNIANRDNIAQALTTVQEVMKLGVDVNAVDDTGRTAMHIAAFTGADSVVQYLADHGASIDPENEDGETPWTMASGISPDFGSRGLYGHHTGTAELLVKLGAKPRTIKMSEAEAPAGK